MTEHQADILRGIKILSWVGAISLLTAVFTIGMLVGKEFL
jgi:hypothetical protein